MEWLIRNNFNSYIDYFELKKLLRNGNKVILIENIPNDDFILSSIISNFGLPINEKKNINGKSIYEVKVFKRNGHFSSIANSNLGFPLHTDCADFKIIPNCIALFCVKPAERNEGANTFSFLHNFINQFSNKEIDQLMTKKWNYKGVLRSVLSNENNDFKLCYDRITIESYNVIDNFETEILDFIDIAFMNNTVKFNLKSGDLLIFRNDKLLHGRDGFKINSKRLLKRLRFDIEL